MLRAEAIASVTLCDDAESWDYCFCYTQWRCWELKLLVLLHSVKMLRAEAIASVTLGEDAESWGYCFCYTQWRCWELSKLNELGPWVRLTYRSEIGRLFFVQMWCTRYLDSVKWEYGMCIKVKVIKKHSVNGAVEKFRWTNDFVRCSDTSVYRFGDLVLVNFKLDHL